MNCRLPVSVTTQVSGSTCEKLGTARGMIAPRSAARADPPSSRPAKMTREAASGFEEGRTALLMTDLIDMPAAASPAFHPLATAKNRIVSAPQRTGPARAERVRRVPISARRDQAASKGGGRRKTQWVAAS